VRSSREHMHHLGLRGEVRRHGGKPKPEKLMRVVKKLVADVSLGRDALQLQELVERTAIKAM
jgi:hypothetical protein